MKNENYGTKQWSTHNAKSQLGCPHGCRYCYARAQLCRTGQVGKEEWCTPQPATFRITKKEKGVVTDPLVMYPTSHDIVPELLDNSLDAIGKILEKHDRLLIVSKPHLECIERICKEFKDSRDRILFRFTIGSTNDSTLRYWEPGAPIFEERMNCLQLAYLLGFGTSVACEPMLDFHADRVVKSALPYVTETVWLGIMNNPTARMKHNDTWDPSVERWLEEVPSKDNVEYLMELYGRWRNHPMIRWKDSLSRVIESSKHQQTDEVKL